MGRISEKVFNDFDLNQPVYNLKFEFFSVFALNHEVIDEFEA